MTIANVATTDLFSNWITKTNQLIVVTNLFTDGVSNANNIRSNTETIASWASVGGVNVGSTLLAAFAQANTANTRAYLTSLKAGDTMTGNLVMSGSNIEFTTGNTGIFWNAFTYISEPMANTVAIITSGVERLRIDNSGIVNVSSALLISNMNVAPTIGNAFNAANAAFAQANTTSTTTAAFARANVSFGNIFVTGTDSTYNWANVAPGNIGITATNSANTIKFIQGVGVEIDVDIGNNAVRFLTGAFAQANAGFNVGQAGLNAANAAFAVVNTHTTQITAAFGAANSAFASGNVTATATTAAFAKANTAIITNTSDRLSSLGVGTAASGTAGEIRATNDITAFYSDMRLKDKIATISNALASIKQLEGFRYRANDIAVKAGFSNEHVEIGLSAQDVQKVAPEAVKFAPFDSEYNEDGELVSLSGENYLTINYDRLIPLLIEAIKELADQVNHIEDILDFNKLSR